MLSLVINVKPAMASTLSDLFFDQTLGDFSEELNEAKTAGKKGILLFFEMDECPFCYRMKESVLNQQDVQALFKKHFLIFSIDIESDIEITDFHGRTVIQKEFALKQFRVRATPVMIFINLDGKIITRYIGATKNKQEFLWLGEYVLNQTYLKMPFARYKRQKRQSEQHD